MPATQVIQDATPFTRPTLRGTELANMAFSLRGANLSGVGVYKRKCSNYFGEHLGVRFSALRPSYTAGLEVSELLLNVQPYDEVIHPSYTFRSTAQFQLSAMSTGT